VSGRRLGVVAALVALAVVTSCRGRGSPAASGRPAAGPALARWRELERREVGAFWRCLAAADVDVDRLANGQQVRRLVESAHDREGGAARARIETTCVPMLTRARRSLAALAASPPGAKAYESALARLEPVLGAYAERMRGWEGGGDRADDGDHDDDRDEPDIAAYARAWSAAGTSPTREALAYDAFLACVVPEVDQIPSAEALAERLSNDCFRGDLGAFVRRARDRCVPALLRRPPPGERAAFARRRRLRDAGGRQERLWAQCLELAEEQERLHDGAPLVAAVDEVLATRPRRD
jgi:hypothetical protein